MSRDKVTTNKSPNKENRSDAVKTTYDSTCLDRHINGSTNKNETNKYNESNINSNTKIKQEQKMTRQKKKEEKRRLREEEVRRKLIAPKSEHLKIIDQKFKDLVSSKSEVNNNNSSRMSKSNNLDLGNDGSGHKEFTLDKTLDQFPDLQLTHDSNKESNKSRMNRNIQLPSTSSLDCRNEKTPHERCDVNETDLSVWAAPKRKVRRDTPIEFNIAKALQCVKKTKFSKTQNHILKKSKLIVKKHTLLCGNSLDADNPTRRRGKVREKKRIKYTRIRQILINNKQLRSLLANEERQKLETCNRLCVDGLDVAALYQLENEPFQNDESNKDISDNKISQTNFEPKNLIHSRKFQSYCDQWPNKEMEKAVFSLIKMILRFHDRLYANDPIKANAKRRFVCGFHEVMRYIKINKVKLLIIATDIDCGIDKTVGGLLDCITQLTTSADALNVPYVYSGTRWSLGTALKKKRPVSSIAVLNHEGAEEFYKTIIYLLPQVKGMYIQKLNAAECKCGITKNITEDVTEACIKAMLSRLSVRDCDETEDASEKSSQCAAVDTNPFLTAIMKTM